MYAIFNEILYVRFDDIQLHLATTAQALVFHFIPAQIFLEKTWDNDLMVQIMTKRFVSTKCTLKAVSMVVFGATMSLFEQSLQILEVYKHIYLKNTDVYCLHIPAV